MNRSLPILVTLVALSLAPALPARAESPRPDAERPIDRPATLGEPTDASRRAGFPDPGPVQSVTPPTGFVESGVRVVPYPHEAPGYAFGATRPLGHGGGR